MLFPTNVHGSQAQLLLQNGLQTTTVHLNNPTRPHLAGRLHVVLEDDVLRLALGLQQPTDGAAHHVVAADRHEAPVRLREPRHAHRREGVAPFDALEATPLAEPKASTQLKT